MKLTVLVDNNTFIDQYYIGEPALSFFIEDAETKVLFDTGYSDVCIQNAQALGIQLNQANALAISHGHNDHTGGLRHLMANGLMRQTKLVAHPEAFWEREADGLAIGSPVPEEALSAYFQMALSKTPVSLSPRLTFLGEIPTTYAFEARVPIGQRKNDGLGNWEPDLLPDDTGLVYKGADGLVIITGCSHSGICNIVAYAQAVCGDNQVAAIIGGFHLFDANPQLHQTIAVLQETQVGQLLPCHCVSFSAKAVMHGITPVQEVGVGMVLEWR